MLEQKEQRETDKRKAAAKHAWNEASEWHHSLSVQAVILSSWVWAAWVHKNACDAASRGAKLVYNDPVACPELLTLTKDQSIFLIVSIIIPERTCTGQCPAVLGVLYWISCPCANMKCMMGDREIRDIQNNGGTSICFMAYPHPWRRVHFSVAAISDSHHHRVWLSGASGPPALCWSCCLATMTVRGQTDDRKAG